MSFFLINYTYVNDHVILPVSWKSPRRTDESYQIFNFIFCTSTSRECENPVGRQQGAGCIGSKCAEMAIVIPMCVM